VDLKKGFKKSKESLLYPRLFMQAVEFGIRLNRTACSKTEWFHSRSHLPKIGSSNRFQRDVWRGF